MELLSGFYQVSEWLRWVELPCQPMMGMGCEWEMNSVVFSKVFGLLLQHNIAYPDGSCVPFCPSCFIYSCLWPPEAAWSWEWKEFHSRSTFHVPRGGVSVIPEALLFQPRKQPLGQGLLALAQSWVNWGSVQGTPVSTPHLSLFALQQLSLVEMLAKVILREMLLDLKKK